jgi:hypothetical protein
MAKNKEKPVWKIVHKVTSYSKKKGSYPTNITVEKDKTFAECVDILKKKYPNKVLDLNNEMRISGFIYPEIILIK